MRRLFAAFAAFAVLGFATVAHASPIQFDTIGVYKIDLTIGDANGAIASDPLGTISGQVSIDEDTGLFVAADFTYVPAASGTTLTFSWIPQIQGTFGGEYEAGFVDYDTDPTGYSALYLFLPVTTLVGYDGGQVQNCNPCIPQIGVESELVSYDLIGDLAFALGGSLTRTDTLLQTPPEGYDPTPPVDPPAVSSGTTPEPSSLILLGTGVLGLAGAFRRRSRTSIPPRGQ